MKIADFRIDDLTKKIATFNRKAVKLGLPEVMATKIGTELRTFYRDDENGVKQPYYVQFTEFAIDGEIPRLHGWMIHSKVEPDSEGRGNFVYTNRGFEPVLSLRTTRMICQHCNMARARSCVYLLQNVETKEQILVGKSCLKDFLPNINVNEVLSYLEGIHTMNAPFDNTDEEGEYLEGSNLPRAAWVYPLDTLVAEAIVVIRKWGFVSKKAAREMIESSAGEKEVVQTSALLGQTGRQRHLLYSDVELNEVSDQGRVGACIEWIKAQPATSDFFYNLQLSIAQAGVPLKMFGFVAAGVNMWIRALEDEIKKSKDDSTKKNEYVGEVGQRTEFKNLTIIREFVNQGVWGSVFITTLEDTEGRSFVWYASKRVGEIGAVVSIRATIKDHKEYKGTFQTVLNRGTFL